MPKDEYDTPGPFYTPDGSTVIRKKGRKGTQHITTLGYGMAAAERKGLVDLLNKGTHFDGMLAALKHARDNCIGPPDQMIDDAIAKAEEAK